MKDAGAIGRHWTPAADSDGDILGPVISEISNSLAAASRRIAFLENGVGATGLTDLQDHLTTVKGTASGIGLEAVDLIARQMEGLLDSVMHTGGRFSRSALDTIARGVDVMTLLVRDVERQRGGHPAAALEEAVDRLLEDVARVSAPRFDDPAPRLRIVHRTASAAPPPSSLEHTLDLVCEVGRYTARRLGKDVIVETAGGELIVPVRLAKAVLGPLEQLVRISVDHGIEAPAMRVVNGKPRTARVEITATLDAGYLVLEVIDDGVELDLVELLGRAEPRNLVRDDAALETGTTLARMFEGSVSSADDRHMMSGRGMIMEVVRRGIDDLDGFMDVYSEAGQGTRVVLRLPLIRRERWGA